MMKNLKLRHLVGGLLALITLVALASIGHGLYDIYADMERAKWAEQGNRLGDSALRASDVAAMERGITVLLLAHPRGTDALAREYAEMRRLRLAMRAHHQTVLENLRQLGALDETGVMNRAEAAYRQAWQDLEKARARVDLSLAREAGGLSESEWIEAAQTHIVVLADMRRAALGPRHERDHPFIDNPLSKEITYTLTEFSGRERALVSVAIARERPFRPEELEKLLGYRGIVNEALYKIDRVLVRMPDEPAIREARETVRRIYEDKFEVLRRQVYAAGVDDGVYPVTADQWFQESSAAINSILALSEQLGRHAQSDIEGIERRARQDMLAHAAAAAAVVGLVLAMLGVFLRRVLKPLQRLERAAHTIGAGNLNEPLGTFYHDELGEVASAFESMRTGLRGQMQVREKAEAMLQASMQRFRGLVESLNDLIWETDREARYTYISPQVQNLLGYTPDEMLGKTPFDFMPPAEAARLRDRIQELLVHPMPFHGLENAALHKAGHRVEFETNGVPIFDKNGVFDGYRGIDRDVTWRKEAEAEKSRLLSAIEQSDDIVIISDPQGNIVYVNAAFERITDYSREEVLGQHTRLLKSGYHDNAFYQRMWSTLKAGESFHATMLDRRKNGELFYTEKTISPLRDAQGNITHYVCTAKDITERHHTEQQMRQTEKLASIGQLAAGVAHEINNPVAYVGANINSLARYSEELFRLCDAYLQTQAAPHDAAAAERLRALMREVDVDFLRQDIRSLISESGEGIERVRQIVRDLKDFSRQDTGVWELADLHRGLDSTLNIVRNELKHKAEVVREYGELPQVECVPAQLNQVFMNLLVNAAQAIESHGTITVRSGHEGDMVWVEVADTGAGIPPENVKRLFEPFFTTKPVGLGTGLGLSLSYGIVQKHGGYIEVDSEPGRGSRFRVWLPVRQPDK